MTTAEFSALLVLATASSFTPGPNTTLSTAIAANRGLRGAMRFVCAVPTGWAGLFVLCALGVGALVMAVPVLRWGILAVGVGYMLWLASSSGSLFLPSAAVSPAMPALMTFQPDRPASKLGQSCPA